MINAKTTALVLCCILACLVSGCILGDDEDKSSIVGVWGRHENPTRRLILRANWTYYSYDDGNGIYETDRGIIITFMQTSQNVVTRTKSYRYVLTEDILTLGEEYMTSEGNTYYTYRDYIRIAE